MSHRRSRSRRSTVAVLGGTFDRLHSGHRALIDAAFRSADTVAIGVTTDSYLRAHPKPMGRKVANFAARRRAVLGYLKSRFPQRNFGVSPLSDGFGRSVEPGVDLLVVSAESLAGGKAVNVERKRRGVPALRLVEVALVTGEDGLPVSSRRVRAGDIDPMGHRLQPLRLHLRVSGPPKLVADARSSLRRSFPGLPLRIRSARLPWARISAPEVDGAARRPRRSGSEIDVTVTTTDRRRWKVKVVDAFGSGPRRFYIRGAEAGAFPRLPPLLKPSRTRGR